MRQVKCYECGRRYNYDEDGFCPKCGAFNQPARASRIGADGTVVYADGLREANHSGSFLHKEFHAEERQRRKYDLDKSAESIQRVANRAVRAAVKPSGKGRGGQKNPVSLIAKIIFAIIALNFLSAIVGILL